jgi:hypothetical protein
MPAGVEVLIEDGVAEIVFVDRAKRGPGLTALLAAGGAESVQKVTRPRSAYRVPEVVARAAGLLDEASAPEHHPEPAPPKGYDDGHPDMDWSRGDINTYATQLGIDAEKLPNKQAVIDAIHDAEAAGEHTPPE